MRVVVWKTKNVPPMDVEGMSDLFVKIWPEGCQPQETDTHWYVNVCSILIRVYICIPTKHPHPTHPVFYNIGAARMARLASIGECCLMWSWDITPGP